MKNEKETIKMPDNKTIELGKESFKAAIYRMLLTAISKLFPNYGCIINITFRDDKGIDTEKVDYLYADRISNFTLGLDTNLFKEAKEKYENKSN